MLHEQHRLSPVERDNLVAYLDGELNDAESQAIATKLTQSLTARRELEALQRTWELLDYLPRPEPSPELATRTIEHVKAESRREGQLFSSAGEALRRAARVLALIGSVLLTVGLSYVATRWLWPDPSARLVRDLTLAENLDGYLDVGSFSFLEQLDEAPEFRDQVARLAFDPQGWSAAERERRLRAMPREERLALAENLHRLDRLSRPERAAVQELDAHLAALPATERCRLGSLLRRYHLWVEALPEPKRDALRAAEGPRRLELMAQYREEDRRKKRPAPDFLRAQFALLGSGAMWQEAHLLRVWLSLEPERRAEIERLKQPKQRRDRLHELAKSIAATREEKQARQKIGEIRKRIEVKGQAGPGADQPNPKAQAKAQRWAEALYFLEHEPEPVPPRKLRQFEGAMPDWLRDPIDPLPPDAARRKLAALYRLIFPTGEMPDPPPPPAQANPPGGSRSSVPTRPSAEAGAPSATVPL